MDKKLTQKQIVFLFLLIKKSAIVDEFTNVFYYKGERY